MADEQSTRLPIPLVVEDEEEGILPGDFLSLEARSQELVLVFGFNQEILAGYLDLSSRRQYCRDFYAYLEYAGSSQEALRPRTMERWVLWLVNHPQGYSPKTINRMLSAVKKIMTRATALDYLDRATAQGFADVERVREVALKERIRIPVVITPEQMEEITAQPDTDRLIGLRDLAMLLTLASSGLRVTSFCQLKQQQIVVGTSGYQLMIRGKNDVDYSPVPLSASAYHAIQVWLAVRLVPSEYLFTHFEGGEGAGPNARLSAELISDRSVRRIVRTYAQAVGLEGVKPHDFRRYLGTQLSEIDVHQAMLALHHKNASTTLNHYVLSKLREGISDHLVPSRSSWTAR
jgi:integrase/recombinase XerD